MNDPAGLEAPPETAARAPVGTIFQTEWPLRAAGPPPPRRSRFGFFRELPALIAIAFTLAVVMKTLLIQAFFIPSESMEPTLHGCPGCSGDRIIVNKLAYRFREPRRGEIIVFIAKHGIEDHSVLGRVKSFFGEGIGLFKPSETDFVKRIIGLPGDTIKVDDGGVTITPPSGRRVHLHEPYIFSQLQQGPSYGPFKVPPDHYFVMGDNRAQSADSRTALGPIKRSDIIGKAFVRIWPVPRWAALHVPMYAGLRGNAAARRSSGPLFVLPVLVMVASVRRRE
jgi:signal peptidase I